MAALLFSILMYVLPWVILPFIVRDNPLLKRLGVLVFFLGSFVGEFTYIISLPEYGFSSLFTSKFWKLLINFYPMAILPLGFWVVLLSVSGRQLVTLIAARQNLPPFWLNVQTIVLGSVTGAIFMALYVGIAILLGASAYPREGTAPYLFAGLVTGASMGMVCVKFSPGEKGKVRDEVSDDI